MLKEIRFRFSAIDPETETELEVEASYEPAEPQSLEHPGCLDAIEICRAWNNGGEPVAFSEFEDELLHKALRLARAGIKN